MAQPHIQRVRIRIKVQDSPPPPPAPTPKPPILESLVSSKFSGVAFLLLLGALVALFNVIVGGNTRNSSPSQQLEQQAAQVAPPPNTPTPPAPTPTSTPTPEPEIVETDNPAVSITLYPDSSLGSNGRMIFKFLRFDERVADKKVEILSLVKDIVGDWAVERAAIAYAKPDVTGLYTFDLPPYTYLVTPNYVQAFIGRDVYPNWFSDNNLMDSFYERWGIIFPVESGKVTLVEVRLSKLVVGVLDERGKALSKGRATPGCGVCLWAVALCAEDYKDFSKFAYYCPRLDTDARGQIIFYVAPGDFFLEIPAHWTLPRERCFGSSSYPVTVGYNELKEITITVNTYKLTECQHNQPLLR